MPLYDYRCGQCDIVREVFRRMEDTGPRYCERCGSVMQQVPPRFHFLWSRQVQDYYRPRNEDEAINWDKDGIWVTRVKSTRRPDGAPERCLISSQQELRRFCREEGLVPPDDVDSKQVLPESGRSSVETKQEA